MNLLTRMYNAPKRWRQYEKDRKERLKLKKSKLIDKSKFSEKYNKEMEERRKRDDAKRNQNKNVKKEDKTNKKVENTDKKVKKTDDKTNKKVENTDKKVEKTRLTKEERKKHETIAKEERKKMLKEKANKAGKEKAKGATTKGGPVKSGVEYARSKGDDLAGYRRGPNTALGKDTRITKHLKKAGWTEDRLAAKRKAHAEWKAKRKNKNKLKSKKVGG